MTADDLDTQLAALEELASKADELHGEAAIVAARYPEGTTSHTVRLVAEASDGFRRAIAKIRAKAERDAEAAEAKAARLAEWQEAQVAKANLRQYDEVVQFMAKDRGISLDEAQAIQDAARTRYREAMRKGSIEEQMAKLEPK